MQTRNSGSDAFAAARDGQSIPVPGQVQTGTDGRARLDLSSRTLIRVAPSSLFTLQSNESSSGSALSTILNLDFGKLWIILKGGSLSVDVGSGQASVRGSYMNVRVEKFTDVNGNEKIKIVVTCFEGDCKVENNAGSVSLVAGQASEFEYDPATGTVTEPTIRNMTEEEINEWVTLIDETQDIMDSAFATMTAMAPSPEPSESPSQNGTVPGITYTGSGSYASNPQFSLGVAQVTIPNPSSGVVTASVVNRRQFMILQAGDLTLLSHGLSIVSDGPGFTQVCFAYPPTKTNLTIVRWDPSGKTGDMPGAWIPVDAFKKGMTVCAYTPTSVFALAGK